jgi:hypothetical protein
MNQTNFFYLREFVWPIFFMRYNISSIANHSCIQTNSTYAITLAIVHICFVTLTNIEQFFLNYLQYICRDISWPGNLTMVIYLWSNNVTLTSTVEICGRFRTKWTKCQVMFQQSTRIPITYDCSYTLRYIMTPEPCICILVMYFKNKKNLKNLSITIVTTQFFKVRNVTSVIILP